MLLGKYYTIVISKISQNEGFSWKWLLFLYIKESTGHYHKITNNILFYIFQVVKMPKFSLSDSYVIITWVYGNAIAYSNKLH